MLAFVVSRLFALFGIRLQFVEWHSPVTKTFALYGGSPFWRAVTGSLVRGGLAHAALSIFLYLNRATVTASANEIAMLYLAVGWLYVGPVLIWLYESYVLPYMVEQAADVLDAEAAQEFQNYVFKGALRSWTGRLILILWMGFFAYLFYSIRPYVESFGFAYNSVSWWVIFVGVLIANYYQTFGIYFVIRSFGITSQLCALKWELNPYHEDGRGGIGFVGYFAAATAAMFGSGVLFAPLLLDASQFAAGGMRIVILIPLAVYSFLILLAFGSPLIQVHFGIEKNKRTMNAQLRREAIASLKATAADGLDADKNRYQVYRQVIDDIRSIRTWPIGFLGASTGVLSTILPLLLGYFRELFRIGG